ncbi:MAG TPA: hypothetical protein VH985_24680 [Candidatus Binatia bacterium]
MIVLLRLALKIGVFLVVLFAGAYIALFFALRSAKFADWMQAKLAQRTGMDVRLAQIGFSLPFGVVVNSFEVSKSGEFLLTTRKITATVNPLDLFSETIYRLDLEEPLLQLDIQELGKSTAKVTSQIALRYLNVHDGTVVLKKGDTTVFELPKINVNAQNFNFGGQIGVTLRSEIPQLDSEAELQMTGQLRNFAAEIVIRPKPSQSLFTSQESKAVPADLVRLRAKLYAPENQKADATIESKLHGLAFGDARITGDLDARIEIDADWKRAAFSARVDVTDFPKSIYPNAVSLPNGKLTANFAGAYALPSKSLSLNSVEWASPIGTGTGAGEIQFEPLAHIANAKLTVRDIPLGNLKALLPAPFNQWTVQGRGQLELGATGTFDAFAVNGVFRGDTLQIRSGAINVANLSVGAPFEWSKTALRIQDAKLNATKLAYGTTERWQGSAERMQTSGSFDFKAGEPLKINGEMAAAGGKFSSPDGSKVGENLTLAGPFEITAQPATKSTRLTGKFRAHSGELLWGKFFADIKTQAPVLELTADYLRAGDRFDCHPCKITLARVGTVEVAGAVENLSQSPELYLQARSANFSPGGFFEFALRETFKRQYPVLDKISLDGQMNFQMNLAGPAVAPAIHGELSLKSGALRAKDGDWQIGPIALNLPFQIALSEGKREPAGSPPRGTLSVERAFFGKQSLGSVMAIVSLWNNALQFHQPIRAHVFGGEIEIANLFWPDVIGDPKRVSFAAAARQLQLAQLTAALNWHPFAGTLTGAIPEVQSTETLLRTTGEIQAEVFGGGISIGRLEIENPFSSLASIRLDAKLSGIQLEQLSRTFEFGGISGILEGSIDELVITDNQPSQFRAEVHSVDRGTEQRISVEALNKITVLSSGENAGALYSGLASFFDSFRYSKLGFKASLRNDRLTLRGVESRGDQEFLVVGSFLPPTVNIISHTQNIAFSELMQRLQRIKGNRPEIK